MNVDCGDVGNQIWLIDRSQQPLGAAAITSVQISHMLSENHSGHLPSCSRPARRIRRAGQNMPHLEGRRSMSAKEIKLAASPTAAVHGMTEAWAKQRKAERQRPIPPAGPRARARYVPKGTRRHHASPARLSIPFGPITPLTWAGAMPLLSHPCPALSD